VDYSVGRRRARRLRRREIVLLDFDDDCCSSLSIIIKVCYAQQYLVQSDNNTRLAYHAEEAGQWWTELTRVVVPGTTGHSLHRQSKSHDR
jgi:hypothetical protein